MTASAGRARTALSTAQIVTLSFAAFIALGTALLALPACHRGGAHFWVDDLFTATSAVCVTGLTTIDLGSHYSPLGQAVLVLLVQLGGLGYMTLYSFAMILVGQRLSMHDRFQLKEATDQPGLAGLFAHVRRVLGLTLVAEALGFGLLATQTVPEFGWWRGSGLAAFLAVCAPNNAGFSMFPDGLIRYQHNPVVLLTLCALIVFGGLGFNVTHELVSRFVWRKAPNPRWQPLVVVVLGWTAGLLLASTLLLWGFEHANPRTLAPMDVATQWLNAFFLAVQARTSGFNSLDLSALTRPSALLLIPLMFVGTGPGGTGGGLKLTTLSVLFAASWAPLRGRKDVSFRRLRRRLDEEVVRKAIALLMLSLALVGVATFAIAALEPRPLLWILFEVVSAFATAGMTLGLTPLLSTPSKLILAATMFAGRVGMLMLALAFVPRQSPTALRYPRDSILIG